MGAPVGGIHTGSAGGEVLGQSQGCRGAGAGHRNRHPLAQIGGTVDGGGPAQAKQRDRQPHQHRTEDQLAPVHPFAADQREHEQGKREQGRKDAEGADRLDLEHHDPHQQQAEDGHASAEEQQPPPTGLGNGTTGLAAEKQGQQGEQQHRQIGQAPKQGEGLAEEGAPGAVQDLVAGFGATGAGERADQAPTLEGDGSGIDRADGGQHGHRHTHPAAALITASSGMAQSAGQAGGCHGDGSGRRQRDCDRPLWLG